MKFEISSVDIYHDPEKLIAAYPCLSEFEFGFDSVEKSRRVKIRDEVGNPMYQEMPYTIDIPYIHLNGVDDLMRLINAVGNPIIIDYEDGRPTIEIYDGYRE